MDKRILVVEDERPLSNALVLKLRSVGFETVSVDNGEAAISVLQESQFDLIILDLILPKADGFFVLAELKRLKITTPVIVSSNLGQEEDVKRAKELGAKAYFVKSDTTLAEIVQEVRQIIV